MDRKADQILTLQIAWVQGLYWMVFCPIASYASVYLLSKDFSNQRIGWVIAISNVLAIVLQPALGALIDRVRRIPLKAVMTILSLMCMLMLVGVILLHPGMAGTAILYMGIIALLLSMQPLVTSLTFRYINAGHDISFGVTRSAGSICFAVLSPLLGILVDRNSTAILPVAGLILFAVYLLVVQSLPKVDSGTLTPQITEKERQASEASAGVGFLRRYDRFVPFLIGIACLFIFHSIINNFLPQIVVSAGGRETDIGVSLTIAALFEMPAFLGFNYLVRKVRNQTLLIISGIFYVLRSVVFLLAASVWMINVGQAMQVLSFGLFIPASVYFVNKLMREEDRVKGQTLVTGMSTLGSFFGSVIGGRLLDQSGVTGMLVFGLAGVVVGCLLMIYAVSRRRGIQQDARTKPA